MLEKHCNGHCNVNVTIRYMKALRLKVLKVKLFFTLGKTSQQFSLSVDPMKRTIAELKANLTELQALLVSSINEDIGICGKPQTSNDAFTMPIHTHTF